MNITYSENAKQSEDFVLIQQATKRLEEILGNSAALVKAEWDREKDLNGRPVYSLSLSDWTGRVKADFTPGELQSPGNLRYRLHRLWGDLLQVRSQKQLEQLTGPAEGAGD